MASLKEITVFTVGDSQAISTWSNVPYFFTKTLEQKNIKVNRINLEENKILNLIYKFTVYAFLKLIYKNSSHTYFRSGLNYFLSNLKIKRAIKQYPSSEVYIFLSYSFSAPKNLSKKTVLFGDWTYLYLIRNFLKREALWFEKNALQREASHINEADLVLSLFPGSKKFNIENFNNPECHYLGNVINSEYPLNKNDLPAMKLKSNNLLFIGNKKYLSGALELISTFKKLRLSEYKDLQLHFIGLTQSDTGQSAEGLYYHGYLDKGNKQQNALYYNLISEAKFIINTTKGWGAFSAMTEAMYYYTPVITTPYSEFINTYGSSIDFGSYVNDNSPEELISVLKKLLNSEDSDYIRMMEQAHEQVKAFTWKNYADKILELIS